MEVPVSIGSGWTSTGNNFFVQYNGIIHGKRMVNATLTRIPNYYHYFFENETVMGWLGGFRLFKADTEETLRRYVDELPIGYIIVNQDKARPGQTEDILGRFNAMDFLCPVTVEGAAVLYATASHPARCVSRTPPEIEPGLYQIDFGQPGDEFFVGLGFHRQEIIGGPAARWLGFGDLTEAQIYVELPPGQDYTLSLEATAFDHPRPLFIYAGEKLLGEFEITDEGYGVYQAELPVEVLGANSQITLRLVYDDPVSAAELGLSGDERPIAIALNWLRFVGDGAQ